MRQRDLARAIAHRRAQRGSAVVAVGEGVQKEFEKERTAKRTERSSFAGVQQFPAWDWTPEPEAVIQKDTSYQHRPLQPASHLWADLITASSADQRKGNARKGG